MLGLPATEFLAPDCHVCGLDWDCHGRSFGAPFCEAHGVCWACQRLNLRAPDCHVCGLDRPATNEVLELHFVRLMVFAGPASA